MERLLQFKLLISVNSIQSIYGQEMHYNTIYIYLYFTIIYIKNYY